MAVLFNVIAPWYCLDNILLNYCIYATIVGLFALLMAVVAHKVEGLGPVIDGFCSVDASHVRDAQTLVEDSVDALKAAGAPPAATADATARQDGGVSLSAGASSRVQHNSSDEKKAEHAAAGMAAAQAAAKTKGAQAAPQSLDGQDIAYLKELLKKHKANDGDAWKYLANTAVFWCGAMFLMHTRPTWWSVMLVGGVNVRIFIIFHDACHKSFFTTSRKNSQLAAFCSSIICQNAADWTKSHNHHHRHLGRFDIPDFSLTVWFSEKEYHSMTPILKFAYRLIRDPLVLPPLLSWFVFWIFPLLKDPTKTVLTRGCFYVPLYLAFGQRTMLLSLLATWIGGIAGILLFHLQHQCNTPYRVTPRQHSKWDAGMLGSTHLLVPWPLTAVTAGIEFHHIHHASTQVPSYHLADCHREGQMHRRGDGGTGASTAAGLWDRAGVNRVGPRRAFLSLFHTLFEGDTKYSHADAHDKTQPQPRFRAFDMYRFLGLEDVVEVVTAPCR